MDKRTGGFALVALAAAIWATDAFFRLPAAAGLDAPVVVLAEHVLLVIATAPFLPGALRAARRFTRRQLLALLLVGAGASAVATTLFTLAFSYGDPTTPQLLQKLQPVIAIVAARAILGERLLPRFAPLAVLALAGAWLVAFPDPLRVGVGAAAPAALAFGAAALWAMGTVLGRLLTGAATPTQVATLRFAVGLPTAAVIVAVTGGDVAPALDPSLAPRLLALALLPGLLGLWLYYRGLARTPASAATIAELSFPLTAVVVNRLAFGATLSGTQVAGIAVLLAVVVWLGVADRRAPEATGVVVPRRHPEPVHG